MSETGTTREERTFWIVGHDGVEKHTALATDQTGYWWFPAVGQPGWGTSMQIGYGAFEGRDEAIKYALGEARRSLKYAQERVEKWERIASGAGK